VRRKLYLAEHGIDHAVHQVFLVGNMPVHRHGFDLQLFSQLAHAECLDAAGVGEGDGSAQNLLAVEPGSWLGNCFRR
jgi:hypothetical protein